ncbi:MAG: copper ion binding protein, partial [Desulfuromonadales bacterium]|nr:copper ion binding protein [Desulfuromonadales bacterium]
METAFPVAGMSCQKCVGKVTALISGFDGVVEVEVTLQPGAARVVYDPRRLELAQITALLRQEGYPTEAGGEREVLLPRADSPPARQRQTFSLGGMSCANCARTIEKGIGALPGVTEATVN